MTTRRFEGRSVLVTGAASGLGRATAALFAQEGANVFVADVNAEGIAQTLSQLENAGGTAKGAVCNVTDPVSVRATVDAAVGAYGGLHVLVNAAGVGGSARFEEIEEADWRRVLSVNLDGPFFMMKAAIPHLLTSPGGNIVNVASIAGLRGQAYNSHYSASKAGMVNLTRSVAIEFASRGLRANCLCPGGIMTPLIRNFIPRPDFEPALVAYYSPPIPHRLAQPEAVAKVIAFLASDDAQHVNGAAMVADDGTSA